MIYQRRRIIHRSRPRIEDAIILAKKYLEMKRKLIIFAMDIESCELIAKELKIAHENVFLIHSKLKEDVYKLFQSFKSAEYGALIGAKMLDEGINIPDAEIGINVSSSKTRLQLVQRIGRILRRKEGKNPIFHHFVAVPESSSYIKEEDNMNILDEISWVQDTALKMGVQTELQAKAEPINSMKEEAEKYLRERYVRHNVSIPYGHGTLRVEKILDLFSESVIENILEHLSNLEEDHIVLDAEWSDIVKKAHSINDDIPLNLPGYWWILVLGERKPGEIKRILVEYRGNI